MTRIGSVDFYPLSCDSDIRSTTKDLKIEIKYHIMWFFANVIHHPQVISHILMAASSHPQS